MFMCQSNSVPRVDPTMCHVSESMFSIQFTLYIYYFYSI